MPRKDQVMVQHPIKKTLPSPGGFRHPIKKTPPSPGGTAGVRHPIKKNLPSTGGTAGVWHPIKKTPPSPGGTAGVRHPIKKTPPSPGGTAGVRHPIKKTLPSTSGIADVRHPIKKIASPLGGIASVRHPNKKTTPSLGAIAGVQHPMKKTTSPLGGIVGARHPIKKTISPPGGHPIKKTLLPPGVIAGENNFFHSHSLHEHMLQAQDPISCKVCDKCIDGKAYGCDNFSCNFYIHKTCFKLPRTITHNSHPASSLKLRARSRDLGGSFICNACGESGKSFHYHSIDNFNLHIGCAALTGSMTHELYLLKLLYSFPLYREPSTTKCKVCTQAFPSNCWVYYNKNHQCIYHLKCVTAGSESTAIEIQRRLNTMIPKPVSSSSSSSSLFSRIFKH